MRRGIIGIEFGKDYLLLFQLSEEDEKTVRKIVKAKKDGKPFTAYLTPKEMRRIHPKKKK